MNDPIKDFIEKNRAEFDHLEAPAFDINKFKASLPAEAPKEARKEARTIALFARSKWLVAASVVAALVTFGLLSKDTKIEPQVATAHSKTPSTKSADKSVIPANETAAPADKPVVNNTNGIAAAHAKAPNRSKRTQNTVATNNSSLLYAQLADSSSASNRLSAILAIDDKAAVSNDLFKKLASTLNHDGNSNVRLAALGVMKKYSSDAYVSSLLVSSLNTQLDPMVQLELVNILGKMEHLKIEDKLYALASDPNTFDAVKDEAYNILLNQNKL